MPVERRASCCTRPAFGAHAEAMFTGIITDVGEVLDVSATTPGLRRVVIGCRYDRASIVIGASIACAGVCLTVVATGDEDGRTTFAVDVAAEALAMTCAGKWRSGTRLNLERPLKFGDEIGGHLVAGHVDGVATVLAREDLPDMVRITLQAPREFARFLARKGSVTLDGVALTVNEVSANEFSVLMVPHTLAVTTLGAARTGDTLNLEVDQLARHAVRVAEEGLSPLASLRS
jgi:riboflavin synthase